MVQYGLPIADIAATNWAEGHQLTGAPITITDLAPDAQQMWALVFADNAIGHYGKACDKAK